MTGTTMAPRREQREMMVTQRRPYPHTAIGGEPGPPSTVKRVSTPWHDNTIWGGGGRGVEGVEQQQGRFWWILTKVTKRKIRETSREGERNRKFVSDSSLMKFPLINSEEEEFKMALELCSPCPHCIC